MFVSNQAIMELLAFRQAFGRPVPVVLTDCTTEMRIFTLEGSEVREFRRRVVVGGETRFEPFTLGESAGIFFAMMSDEFPATEEPRARPKKRKGSEEQRQCVLRVKPDGDVPLCTKVDDAGDYFADDAREAVAREDDADAAVRCAKVDADGEVVCG